METGKKLEIILGGFEVEGIVKIFDRVGIPSYTIMRNGSGRDDHGFSDADLEVGVANSYIVAICRDSTELDNIIKEVKPLIKRFGGTFFVTDALWYHH
jgi:nitrogen regulatory protein PII